MTKRRKVQTSVSSVGKAFYLASLKGMWKLGIVTDQEMLRIIRRMKRAWGVTDGQ